MAKRSMLLQGEWAVSASSLSDGSAFCDPDLIPAMPHDGRDLPDVVLSELIKAFLADLTRRIGEPMTLTAGATPSPLPASTTA